MQYLKHIKYTLLICLFGFNLLQAQNKSNLLPFGCQPNFYQLKENQLCILTKQFDGKFWFQPILEPFSFQVSAIGLHAQEGLMYILNKDNGHILKLGKLGNLEDLGLPKSKMDEVFPYKGLTVGELARDYFFVYNQEDKNLYKIDLKTFYFEKVLQFVGEDFTNISFDAQTEELLCIDAANKLLKIQIYSKEVKIEKGLVQLPSGRAGMGSIWSTVDGRWFVGRMQNAQIYEVNLTNNQISQITTNPRQTVEDGTSCPYAEAPSFLDKELLKLYTEPYVDERLTWIKWSDRGGLDIDHYELEKSTGGHFWELLARKPSASNGLSRMNPYSGLDKSPSSKLNYYRLKQVFKYGSQQYSQTILKAKDTTVWQEPFISISPNILFKQSSTSLLCNGLEGEELILTIKDSYGQQVFKTMDKVLNPQIVLTIPTQDLVEGGYTLKVTCSKGVFIEHFLKL